MAFTDFDETKITDDSAATLSIEVLNYYRDRLQKRMEIYSKQADDMRERGYKLISIFITLLTVVLSFIFYRQSLDECTAAMAILAISTTVSIILMYLVILPRTYYPQGRSLEELQPNRYAQAFSKTPDNEQIRWVLRDELNMQQDALLNQCRLNGNRVFWFKAALWVMMIGAMLSVATFIIGWAL